MPCARKRVAAGAFMAHFGLGVRGDALRGERPTCSLSARRGPPAKTGLRGRETCSPLPDDVRARGPRGAREPAPRPDGPHFSWRRSGGSGDGQSDSRKCCTKQQIHKLNAESGLNNKSENQAAALLGCERMARVARKVSRPRPVVFECGLRISRTTRRSGVRKHTRLWFHGVCMAC